MHWSSAERFATFVAHHILPFPHRQPADNNTE
jgi:hypothetical protein